MFSKFPSNHVKMLPDLMDVLRSFIVGPRPVLKIFLRDIVVGSIDCASKVWSRLVQGTSHDAAECSSSMMCNVNVEHERRASTIVFQLELLDIYSSSITSTIVFQVDHRSQ